MIALTHIPVYITHKDVVGTQNHGRDACSSGRKKRDLVSSRLKLHMRRTITEGTRVSRKERAHQFENGISLHVSWW